MGALFLNFFKENSTVKSIRVHALEGSMVSTWKGLDKLYNIHIKEKEDVQIYVLPPTRDPDLSFYKLLDAAENKDEGIWNMLEQKKTAWLELVSSSLKSEESDKISSYIVDNCDLVIIKVILTVKDNEIILEVD